MTPGPVNKGIIIEKEPLTERKRLRLLAELEQVIESGSFIESGQAFLEIRNNGLFCNRNDAGRTFNQYCTDRWGIHRMAASRLIGAADAVENLLSAGLNPLPMNERQARPLTRLSPDQQVEAWKRVLATARGDRISAMQIESVVQRHIKESVFFSSESNEWYTPPEYIKAIRAMLGNIDLDPASSELANRTVQADRFFSVEDDGLSQPWNGRVYLNPPYGRDQNSESNQAVWSSRLIREYETGSVTEAILLVNAAIGDAWFAELWNYCLCFAHRRIRFVSLDGRRNQPTKGNVFVYFGTRAKAFVLRFAEIGHCVVPRGKHGKYSEVCPVSSVGARGSCS